MLDRTDLQLMICEQIMDMPTESLIEMFRQVVGGDLELYDEEQDIVIGDIESLDIEHPPSLKTWLGFLLYALGERIQKQEEAR